MIFGPISWSSAPLFPYVHFLELSNTIHVDTSRACSVIDEVFHSCLGDELRLVRLPRHLRTRALVTILKLLDFSCVCSNISSKPKLMVMYVWENVPVHCACGELNPFAVSTCVPCNKCRAHCFVCDVSLYCPLLKPTNGITTSRPCDVAGLMLSSSFVPHVAGCMPVLYNLKEEVVCVGGDWHGLLSSTRHQILLAFVGHMSLPSGLNHQRSLVDFDCIRSLVSLGLITAVLVHHALVVCADVEVILADVRISSVVGALRVEVGKPGLRTIWEEAVLGSSPASSWVGRP